MTESKSRNVAVKQKRKMLVETVVAHAESSLLHQNLEQDVDEDPHPDNIVPEVTDFLSEKIQECRTEKCVQTNIMLKPTFRSKYVQCTPPTASCLTSPFKHQMKDMSTSFSPCKRMKITEISDGESDISCSSRMSIFGSDYFITSTTSSGVDMKAESEHLKKQCLRCTVSLIEKKPKLYLGLTLQTYFIVNLLQESIKCEVRDIMLCLKKIRCNHSFALLGDDFGLSISQAGKIFRTLLPSTAPEMKKLIYWPDPKKVKLLLPLPFTKQYSAVISIIDCMEIEIEKPMDPLKQSLTWSEYYKCNTFKYLISCTPHGFVNFVSTGFGGHTSDLVITERSGYLQHLSPGMKVMADRGFKLLGKALLKIGVELVCPPSVCHDQKLSPLEVMEAKKIASLWIHVERDIGRLRELKFLSPHSCVDNKLINMMDCAILTAAGIINMQNLIIN